MKKVFGAILIVLIILGATTVYASDTLSVQSYKAPLQTQTENRLQEEKTGELTEMKSKAQEEIANYEELYGSKAYGYTAYFLNKIRIFSIPLCFLGIAVGSIYQYVIGIRRMDIRDRGFVLIVGFITVLVICQILPLVFAVVVQGWRG